MEFRIKKYTAVYDYENSQCSVSPDAPIDVGQGDAQVARERVLLSLSKLDPETGLYREVPRTYDSAQQNKIKIGTGKYRASLTLVKEFSTPYNVPCKIIQDMCEPEGGYDISSTNSG